MWSLTQVTVYLYCRIGGGELFEKLANEDHVSEGQAASYTKQVLEALEHLHGLKIAHLDLKVCY